LVAYVQTTVADVKIFEREIFAFRTLISQLEQKCTDLTAKLQRMSQLASESQFAFHMTSFDQSVATFRCCRSQHDLASRTQDHSDEEGRGVCCGCSIVAKDAIKIAAFKIAAIKVASFTSIVALEVASRRVVAQHWFVSSFEVSTVIAVKFVSGGWLSVVGVVELDESIGVASGAIAALVEEAQLDAAHALALVVGVARHASARSRRPAACVCRQGEIVAVATVIVDGTLQLEQIVLVVVGA
jgi:hypothetical protein